MNNQSELRKNILFIMPSLNGGGAEKVLLDILSRIDYSQYSIDLCLILREGVYKNDVPKQVNVIVLYSSLIFQRIDLYLSKYITSFFEKRTIRSKVKKKKYDTIISFLEGDGIKKHQYIIDLASKNITWVHIDLYSNHYTDGNFRKGNEEKSYSLMDEIIFVSEDSKSNFERRFPNIRINKKVIYNPIDKEIIKKKSEENIDFSKNKFLICSVGRIVEQKAYERLLLLAEQLKNHNYDVEFIILGDGPLKKNLITKSKELRIDDIVHFMGFVNNPYPYIKVSDIFLSVSSSEGYSLVLCEALCLGKPVVFTETSGPIEILNNGEYGVLTKHDINSIYNGIKPLIDDPNLREYYEKKANERSLIFNIEDMMKNITDLF